MTEQTMPHLRAPLNIHLEGPAVRHHRLSLRDFVLLGRQLQTAVDRVASILLGKGAHTQVVRKPSELKRLCSLDIVEIRGGSLTILCDLPVDGQPRVPESLGEEVLVAFVEGIEGIGSQQAELPRGYDNGVLLALHKAGKLLGDGIDSITFDLHTRKGHWTSRYTQEVRDRMIPHIQAPMQNRMTLRTVEGRLTMGDFTKPGFRCRLQPVVGRSIPCTFNEEQKEAVLAALTRSVRLVSEATEAKGEILSLKIKDIEVLDRDIETVDRADRGTGFFAGKRDLEALASQQGVSVIDEFEHLLGNFWPEEESADQFIATVREWRREGELDEG